MMSARSREGSEEAYAMFRHSSFDPKTLTLLSQVYSEALVQIEQAGAPEAGRKSEIVRTLIAKRIIGLASVGERDAAALKSYAVRGVAFPVKANGSKPSIR